VRLQPGLVAPAADVSVCYTPNVNEPPRPLRDLTDAAMAVPGRPLAEAAYRRLDRFLDRRQAEAFRFLWWFLPATSIAKRPAFQQLLASRLLSDTAQQALAYGALVATVRQGGNALDAAIVGVAGLLPPALLGLYGGAVADALPKRIALGAAYALQGALCFMIPIVFGTGLGAILALLFAVNALGQVSGPSEGSAVPLVADEQELASANSFLNLASSAGQALGTALLAPFLVRAFGVRTVMYVSGVLLLLASTRVIDLETNRGRQAIDWRPPRADVAGVLRWFARERAVASMLVLGMLGGTASVVVATLGPRYTESVLGVDAADSVYVFAPTAAGLLLALLVAPKAIARLGERRLAGLGFVLAALSLICLGLVRELAPAVDAANPARLLTAGPLAVPRSVRTAALFAAPLGFGITSVTAAVQTYINRRVPEPLQGRAFALQSTLKNGLAIAPLLALGALASLLGVDTMLLVAPLALLAVALVFVRLSYHWAGEEPLTGVHAFTALLEEDIAPASGATADPQEDTPPAS